MQTKNSLIDYNNNKLAARANFPIRLEQVHALNKYKKQWLLVMDANQ